MKRVPLCDETVSMSGGESPDQLTLDLFGSQGRGLWTLRLSGVRVLVADLTGSVDPKVFLSEIGVPFEVRKNPETKESSVTIATVDTAKFVAATDYHSPDSEWPFFQLFEVDTSASPFRMVSTMTGDLEFSHRDLQQPTVVSSRFAAPVVASNLRISASPATWEWVATLYDIPVPIATLEATDRGTAILHTQRFELLSSQLSGNCVQISHGRYVMPLSDAFSAARFKGVRWRDGVVPEDVEPIAKTPSIASYITDDASSLLRSLLLNRAAIVEYGERLSVETLVAAMVSALDTASTVAILTNHSALFAWRRAFNLVGIDPFADDSHVSLLCPGMEFSAGSFAVAIVDATHWSSAMVVNDTAGDFESLDPSGDASRVFLLRNLPDLESTRQHILRVVAPEVFGGDSAVPEAYTKKAFNSHLVSRRLDTLQTSRDAFLTGNTTTELVKPAADISGATNMAALSGASTDHILELCSAGTETVMSAKVSAAISRAVDAARSGAHVSILTRFLSSARKIHLALANYDNLSGSVSVEVYSDLPTLRPEATLVILLDYPVSMLSLIEASSRKNSQLPVVVIHMALGFDDRMARLSATNDDPQASFPLTEEEESWILADFSS